MAFKQDDDFLRFITMGAAGSAAVSRFLRETHGHSTVELERYAMANKIWATKIKRLRLADLVCLNCGTRIEARAKSKLQVRMSHSNAPGREWDAGMRNEDLCAFVPWADNAAAASPECFTIEAMRSAAAFARFGAPKAASEGAERDMTWTTRVPTRDSVVEAVDHARGKVSLRRSEGRRQTMSLPKDMPTHIYVEKGDKLRAGVRFAMGCLARPDTLDCPGETWDYRADLRSVSEIDRYVAIKAAGILGSEDVATELLDIAADQNEDARVRLEAWASLSRLEPERYTREVTAQARARTAGDKPTMALAMEAIFILSELDSQEAKETLSALAADPSLDSEARCASVWGLGVTGANDPARVLPYIADDDDAVALHALSGIGPLPRTMLPEVAAMLAETDRAAASASALLAQQGSAGIRLLLDASARDGSAATSAAGALGELSPEEVRRTAGGTLPDELEHVLAPMWAQRQSWLRHQQNETPLQFLERQTIRYLS